tara:strand:+ start:7780 stop:9033 length:1254 start_codon:yes stop_codon:yes gene_type:complete
MTFDLNMHVARLLMDEPFFAALSRRIEKRESNAIPTAAVRVNPDSAQIEMMYNSDFFEGLTDDQRKGVLIHEFYHIIFEHLTGRMHDKAKENMRLWNIATDLSINCLIGKSKLPEGGLFPGSGPFSHLPANQTAEWYFSKLYKEEEEGQGRGDGGDDEGEGEGQGDSSGDPGDQQDGSGSGGGGSPYEDLDSFDSHEEWGKVDQTTQEMAKERIKDALKDAASEGAQKGWGSVSGDCRKAILERLTTVIDWKKMLRYFVKTSQRADKSTSMKRINRRYPYIHAGRKTNRTASIAVSIDQSGSVNDRMLAAFFSELNKLADIAEFTVIPFDTEVAEDKVYTWKKGEKKKTERVLCGGTCFNAPTEYVNARNFDGHIVLTDMYAPKPKASKCQRMWMTDKGGAARPYFKTSERIVAINV